MSSRKRKQFMLNLCNLRIKKLPIALDPGKSAEIQLPMSYTMESKGQRQILLNGPRDISFKDHFTV
jgi:hypothetical protein